MTLNIEVLERSFERIKTDRDDFAIAFYQNLFADYPEVKPLFANTDMEEQGNKLFASLNLAIENIRHPEILTEALIKLGEKHVEYRVKPVHYSLVGKSLLKTLEAYLDLEWTLETQQAWNEAYRAISDIMLTQSHEGDVLA